VTGTLESKKYDKHGRLIRIVVSTEDGDITYQAKSTLPTFELGEDARDFINRLREEEIEEHVIDYDDGLLEIFGSGVEEKTKVTVSQYTLRNVVHYVLRPENKSQTVY